MEEPTALKYCWFNRLLVKGAHSIEKPRVIQGIRCLAQYQLANKKIKFY
jgi:hypothetical protein